MTLDDLEIHSITYLVTDISHIIAHVNVWPLYIKVSFMMKASPQYIMEGPMMTSPLSAI